MSDADTTTGKSDTGAMDIRGILDYLPHRYPMLLIDRVREIVVGEVSTSHFSPATIRIIRSCRAC